LERLKAKLILVGTQFIGHKKAAGDSRGSSKKEYYETYSLPLTTELSVPTSLPIKPAIKGGG